MSLVLRRIIERSDSGLSSDPIAERRCAKGKSTYAYESGAPNAITSGEARPARASATFIYEPKSHHAALSEPNIRALASIKP